MVYDLSRSLDTSKFRVHTACLSHRGEYADPLQALGIEVIELNKKEGKDLRLPFRLAGIMRRRRIDLIHVHNSWPLFAGAAAALLGRIPGRIFTEHGRQWPDLKRTMRTERIFLSRFQAVVPVSHAAGRGLSDYLGITDKRLHVIHNGVEDFSQSNLLPPADLFQNQAGPTVGFLGRLEPVKGVEVLIKATKRAVQSIPNLRVLICGEGAQEDALKQLTAELDLTKNIVFTGWRYDAPQILTGLDALVLPSLSEGLPMTVLEAFSLAIPVVATEVGGVPEVVTDGKNGLLAPPDNPEALAEVLVKMLSDDQMRTQMGIEAQKTYRRQFSIERMVGEYEALFEQVYSSTGR